MVIRQIPRGSSQGPPAYRSKIDSKPPLVGSRNTLLNVKYIEQGELAEAYSSKLSQYYPRNEVV